MVFGQYRQTIPSNAEYSIPQVRMLVRQVEAIVGRSISLEEWNSLQPVHSFNERITAIGA
jgi:hypothetical protein